jgi:hypothetical protein
VVLTRLRPPGPCDVPAGSVPERICARPPARPSAGIVAVALDVLETPFSVRARRCETRQAAAAAAAAAGPTIRLPAWSKGEAGF